MAVKLRRLTALLEVARVKICLWPETERVWKGVSHVFFLSRCVWSKKCGRLQDFRNHVTWFGRTLSALYPVIKERTFSAF